MLNYLKAEQKSEDKEKFERLYEFLDEQFLYGYLIYPISWKIKEEFAKNPLIFVPDTEKKYYCSREVIWKDVSDILAETALEKYYPKLKRFFVEKLGISEKPTPKDCASVLCSISEKTEITDEDEKIIMRIYEELNRNLEDDAKSISQEDWWDDFIGKSIFLTDKGEFLQQKYFNK